jgi:hypothetical protein
MLEQLIEQQEQELLQLTDDQKRQNAANERLLKNKLKKIFRDIGLTRTRLKPNEQKIVKQAKQHKKLKKDVTNIETALKANKLRSFSKLMSASPALMTIFMYGFFIFLIIVVVASVGSIFSWLFGGETGGNVAFGVTGDDFYGVRMVYQDDEKANKQIENINFKK